MGSSIMGEGENFIFLHSMSNFINLSYAFSSFKYHRRCSTVFIVLVASFCTFSSSRGGDQNCTQHSEWNSTVNLCKGITLQAALFSVLSLIIAIIFVFFTASEHRTDIFIGYLPWCWPRIFHIQSFWVWILPCICEAEISFVSLCYTLHLVALHLIYHTVTHSSILDKSSWNVSQLSLVFTILNNLEFFATLVTSFPTPDFKSPVNKLNRTCPNTEWLGPHYILSPLLY